MKVDLDSLPSQESMRAGIRVRRFRASLKSPRPEGKRTWLKAKTVQLAKHNIVPGKVAA